MRLNDKTYNILKWVCVIALPAVLTFLSTVLPLVGVPVDLTQTIVAIGAAVDTLIGALIGISTYQYNKDKEIEAEKEYEETDER